MQIKIRKFQPGDAPGLYAAVRESIPHLSPWLGWCTENYSLADAEQWVASAEVVWQEGSDYRLVIEDEMTGEIIGSVAINNIIQVHRIGNLGYWVSHKYCGRGIASKAARHMVRYAFDELDFQRIEVVVLPDNLASKAVAEKLGGCCEGLQRNKVMHLGKSVAALCYSIIPNDLQKSGE